MGCRFVYMTLLVGSMRVAIKSKYERSQDCSGLRNGVCFDKREEYPGTIIVDDNQQKVTRRRGGRRKEPAAG